MKKVFALLIKVLLSLMLIMPIFGALGVFPEPTRDMYNSDGSFAFITALADTGYLMQIMGVVFFIALVCLWTKREALAVALLLPVVVNIVSFHLFLDGGLFTPGAIMADLLLVITLHYLWKYRAAYQSLLRPRSA